MYLAKLSDAITYATAAHDGVLDKGGKPYILHPLRVMLQMDTEDEQIVALLHDVVEDTNRTLHDIELEFGVTIQNAVDAMTQRKPDETYFEYIDRLKQNPIAVDVKIADIEDNMSPEREYLPVEERAGRNKRYEKAIDILYRKKYYHQ